MKQCTKCKVTKPKVEFSNKKSSKDGLHGWCKACMSISTKEWRLKSKSHIKNYDKNYKEENALLIKQRKKRYRKEHQEEIKAYMKNYRVENKEKIKESKKEYRKNNIEKIKAYDKKKNEEYRKKHPKRIKRYIEKYRLLNKDKIKENQKRRVLRIKQKNPNYFKEYSKIYHQKNKANILRRSKKHYYQNQELKKAYSRKYAKENKEQRNIRLALRYKNDIQYHLKVKLKNYFRMSFNKNRKKGRMIDYLGMTIPEFKNYLESKFEDWMTWDNIGLYNGTFNFGWDIDHIKPLCLFDLTKEDDIKKAWHYSNMQPLCSKTNREVKRDKYPFKK